MQDDLKELYILEYQGCAARYENLYSAMWTQFNYFLVASGVVLGFGKDALGVPLSGLIACLALVFWYWATFEPLNRYGDGVAKRAAILERILNTDFLKVNIWTRGRGMRHFILYERRRQESEDTSLVMAFLQIKFWYLLVTFVGILILTLHLIPAKVAWLIQCDFPQGGFFLLFLAFFFVARSRIMRLGLVDNNQPLTLNSYTIVQASDEPNSNSSRQITPQADMSVGKSSNFVFYCALWLLIVAIIGCSVIACYVDRSGKILGGFSPSVSFAIIVVTTLMTSGYFLPLLLYRNRMRPGVRTSVRFAAAVLHVSAVLLATVYVANVDRKEDRAEVRIRVDQATGNVSIKGEQ